MTTKTKNPLVLPGPLHSRRHDSKLSADDFAEIYGIPLITVKRIEAGLIYPTDNYLAALSAITTVDLLYLKIEQREWIEYYRSLARKPKLTDLPVYTNQDKTFVRKFYNYKKTIVRNAAFTKTWNDFILKTWTSRAACGKIMKVNISSLEKPKSLPVELKNALVRAGYSEVVGILIRKFGQPGYIDYPGNNLTELTEYSPT